jgi:hypothetical protein
MFMLRWQVRGTERFGQKKSFSAENSCQKGRRYPVCYHRKKTKKKARFS